MPDLKIFYTTLLDTLKDFKKTKGQLFYDQFNNMPECRTVRNRMPRTDLMLGCGTDQRAGVVARALQEFLGLKVQASYERYLDVVVFGGEWWEGRCFARAIVEVENSISEFKGTLSDLLRQQAQQKIAVFYESSAKSRRAEFEDKTRTVFGHFAEMGFCEAAATEYLIVLGPADLKGDGIGDWCGMWFTSGTRDSPVWI